VPYHRSCASLPSTGIAFDHVGNALAALLELGQGHRAEAMLVIARALKLPRRDHQHTLSPKHLNQQVVGEVVVQRR